MEERDWGPAPGVSAPSGLVGNWPRVGSWVCANLKKLIWGVIIIALGLGAYLYVSAPTSASYVVVKTAVTTETLGASGKVRGERVAQIGVDTGGVVQRISVREGDRVTAGQVLLSLDKSEVDARVRSARDAVATAEAELARASRSPLISEVRQAKAEVEQAELVGRAKVAQAQAHLKDIQAGVRPQEVKEAEADLKRRNELLKKAELDLRRIRDLAEVGAVARKELDQAQSSVETARADVSAQEQRVSLLKAGPRSDQVTEAMAAVAEAKASRDTGLRAARERLNTLLSQPRPEDVRAARARVNEARSELSRSLEVAARTDARAPFDGVVADIPVERGQSVSPGQALVVIHEMSKPILEVETDEENLSVLAPGQKAVISSDAYPGRTFEARVFDLGSRVDPERGTIEIKLRPLSKVDWLRPDLTVDVNIITRRNVRRVILPPDTVTKVGRASAVLVAREGVAVPVSVRTGPAGPEGVVVFGKLDNGDKVLRNAAGVVPYSDVRLKRGS